MRIVAGDWTFLTNHAHVLVAIARDPEARLRDVAERVGITERSVQAIVRELSEHGYIVRERVGRRNRYQLDDTLPMRHALEREHSVDVLLGPLGAQSPARHKPYPGVALP